MPLQHRIKVEIDHQQDHILLRLFLAGKVLGQEREHQLMGIVIDSVDDNVTTVRAYVNDEDMNEADPLYAEFDLTEGYIGWLVPVDLEEENHAP